MLMEKSTCAKVGEGAWVTLSHNHEIEYSSSLIIECWRFYEKICRVKARVFTARGFK